MQCMIYLFVSHSMTRINYSRSIKALRFHSIIIQLKHIQTNKQTTIMSGILNKFHHSSNRNTGNLSNSSELPMSATNSGVTQQNTIMNAPIIQETVRQDRVVEVQPVLHRSLDRNIVHHVEKHIHEPAPPTMQQTVQRAPLVQQEFHTNIVHEVQPVIHRERVVPVVERSERHMMERVDGGTVHTHEVVFEGGQGYQQQAQPQYAQQAFPTINNQPIGMMQQTQSVPLYAPPMGVPYGRDGTTGNAKTGKRHHHGVLHRNAH